MLSAVMLSVVMLNVIVLNVRILSVTVPFKYCRLIEASKCFTYLNCQRFLYTSSYARKIIDVIDPCCLLYMGQGPGARGQGPNRGFEALLDC